MKNGRRKFLMESSSIVIGVGASSKIESVISNKGDAPVSLSSDINIVGPKEGFSPQVGTLVSMMNWMRRVVLDTVRGLSIRDLDYIHDEDSNSIGAMLWHLAAVERFYQRNTFGGKTWDGLASKDSAKWNAASNLGASARAKIKGYDLDFYMALLNDVRSFTLDEFKRKDDEWLMIKDYNFWSSPTNNYCKWFHVCEHESNHNGQIKYIKSRMN